jgi:hypothetical protein
MHIVVSIIELKNHLIQMAYGSGKATHQQNFDFPHHHELVTGLEDQLFGSGVRG